MSYFATVRSSTADSPSADAFARLRVSNATTIFDSEFSYGLEPLLFEQTVTGTGAAISHDTTNRSATLAFASTPTGGETELRTFQFFRYQPGKSQQIFISLNFNGGVANTIKFAGYSSGTNGIEFILNGTTPTVRTLSSTTHGNVSTAQSAWSLDKMDGTGRSGITLDFTKIQTLVIDLQGSSAGRVRIGFFIAGQIIYCHQFTHGNSATHSYLAQADLPVRVGMTCTGTVSSTMTVSSISVNAEGGVSSTTGYDLAQEGTGTAASGARTHILSLRPKTTFSSITNRTLFRLVGIDAIATGVNPALIELVLGQAISGTTTFNDVNTTYSASEYNTAGTISGSPALVFASIYVAASGVIKLPASIDIPTRFPITLDRAGAVRALGTVSVLATGLGGATAVRCALSWRETR